MTRGVLLSFLLAIAPPLCADTVLMRDGSRYEGTVVSDTADTIVVDVPQMGKVSLAKSDVQEVRRDPKPSSPKEAPIDPDAQVMAQAGALLGRLNEKPPAAPEEVAPQLAALGPPVVPCLPILARGRMRGPKEDAAQAALKQVVERGIDVSRSLAAAAGNADADVRATALRMLSRAGGPAALDVLLPLMATIDPAQAPMLDLTVVSILARSPGRSTYDKVGPLLRKQPKAALPRLVQCIGLAASPLGVDLLAPLFGSDRAVKVAIANAIARMPPRDRPELADSLASMVMDSDPAVRRACATGIGRLHGAQDADRLIPLLVDSEEEVRQAAQGALCAISGRDATLDRQGWEDWLMAEGTWQQDQAQGAVERLKLNDAVKLVTAAQEAAEHPLSRALLVPPLVQLLRHPLPEVSVAACNALAKLGAVEAVPSLIDALDGGAERVKTAAWEALKKITWMELPPYAEAWRERWGE